MDFLQKKTGPKWSNLASAALFLISASTTSILTNGKSETPYKNKQLFRGVKMKKSCPTFFCGFVIHMKNTLCKKKWVKTPIPALSSDQSNLQTPIWGRHHQLDDQNKNPNINNRDHLVGQLTNVPPSHMVCLDYLIKW